MCAKPTINLWENTDILQISSVLYFLQDNSRNYCWESVRSRLCHVLFQTYYSAVEARQRSILCPRPSVKKLHHSKTVITRMEVTSSTALLNNSPLNFQFTECQAAFGRTSIQFEFVLYCPVWVWNTAASVLSHTHIHTNMYAVWAAVEPDLKTESVMIGNPLADFDSDSGLIGRLNWPVWII